jgi:hypothetical protein
MVNLNSGYRHLDTGRGLCYRRFGSPYFLHLQDPSKHQHTAQLQAASTTETWSTLIVNHCGSLTSYFLFCLLMNWHRYCVVVSQYPACFIFHVTLLPVDLNYLLFPCSAILFLFSSLLPNRCLPTEMLHFVLAKTTAWKRRETHKSRRLTSVVLCQETRGNNPEVSHHHPRRRENLNSRIRTGKMFSNCGAAVGPLRKCELTYLFWMKYGYKVKYIVW